MKATPQQQRGRESGGKFWPVLPIKAPLKQATESQLRHTGVDLLRRENDQVLFSVRIERCLSAVDDQYFHADALAAQILNKGAARFVPIQQHADDAADARKVLAQFGLDQ